MAFTTQTLLDTILDQYSGCYDITRCEENQQSLAATCIFHEHNTGYMLSRKAQMWAYDRHEYLYIYRMDHLTAKDVESGIRQARELGEPQIDLSGDHMSSVIAVVFLCGDMDDDAAAAIRACRIRKSFQFSLKGWM